MRLALGSGDRTVVHARVNGEDVAIDAGPETVLVDAIREQLRLTGTHVGCRTGDCGACTVMIDGRSAKSCLELAVAADGRTIETIESLGEPGHLSDVQEAFDAQFAYQCGFCLPGMLLCATELRDAGGATDTDIRDAIDGNLCRCTGYVNIIEAMRSVLENGT